jgi:hypothetical protein
MQREGDEKRIAKVALKFVYRLISGAEKAVVHMVLHVPDIRSGYLG